MKKARQKFVVIKTSPLFVVTENIDHMKIAISGASGFVGSNLIRYFARKGHKIVPLNRSYFTDNTPMEKLKNALTGTDVIINLAGAPINHPWTNSYRKEMYNSRIVVTRKLVETINSLERKPSVFISASAVGYYPIKGCYDEYSSQKGEGFLSELCEKWEEEAKKISPDVRLAITRFGVILAKTGGAFPLMSLPAKFKIATVIGPGNQPFPWIYLNDLMKAMEHIINQTLIKGTINFVAPRQITNRQLMKAIGRRERSFLTITIPRIFFRLVLGEASIFITTGQCVVPKTLLESGFIFDTPVIDDFLDTL